MVRSEVMNETRRHTAREAVGYAAEKILDLELLGHRKPVLDGAQQAAVMTLIAAAYIDGGIAALRSKSDEQETLGNKP